MARPGVPAAQGRPLSGGPTPYCSLCFASPALRPGQDWQSQHWLAFLEAVRQAPPLSWDLDVDVHYDCWEWTQAWDTCRPPRRSAPRQAYLTAETYALLESRQAFRRFAHDEEAALRRHDLLRGFAAFLLEARGLCASVFSVDRWRCQRRSLIFGLARVAVSLQRSSGILGWRCAGTVSPTCRAFVMLWPVGTCATPNNCMLVFARLFHKHAHPAKVLTSPCHRCAWRMAHWR